MLTLHRADGSGIAVSTCTPTRMFMLLCVACLRLLVSLSALCGQLPSCKMFPESFYSPRCSEVGVASLSRLPFSGFWTMCFSLAGSLQMSFFFLVVLAWLFSLLSLASAWHPGCCVVLQPVRSLWDWQWSSCSLARSSAPLNRCCGDEGASQMVAAHHVIYCLRYWR